MKIRSSAKFRSSAPVGRLRLLETTDLHMQLLDYDHFSDKPDTRMGLLGLADKIEALRNDQSTTTLLFDNGDLLQGNPLADQLAQDQRANAVHPMIGALNLLQYDAMTLGNHDFDYGLTFLKDALAGAAFPVVNANITCANDTMLAKLFVVVDKKILCDDGQRRTIRLGVTGFSPPQVSEQVSSNEHDAIHVDDIVDAARAIVPKMRAAGAELIIALCHSGIGATTHRPRMENAAVPLAAIDGIDVLLMGHTHEAFPDPTQSSTAAIDYKNGTLHDKPAVMATFYGTSLGVIDLALAWDDEAWHVVNHRSYLEASEGAQGADSLMQQKLRALVADPHAATIDKMRQPIAYTDVPIASYFATVQPDLSQQVLARAIQQATQSMVTAEGFDPLPVLAAKSSFRFGGRGGLGHYIDIQQGPITLRDAAAIFPFADRLCAVRRTGHQIKMWLERAAAHYNQINEGQCDQPLINPHSAAYNCDTIFGLTYEIDVTQPSRFDTVGQLIDRNATRIRNICYGGRPVLDTDLFIVGTNSFRATGGGGFPPVAPEDILHTSASSLRSLLINYLSDIGTFTHKVEAT